MASSNARWVGLAGMLFALGLAEGANLFLARAGVLQGLTATAEERKALFVLLLVCSGFVTYLLVLLLRAVIVPRDERSSNRSSIVGGDRLAVAGGASAGRATLRFNAEKFHSAKWTPPPGLAIDVSPSDHGVIICVRGRGLRRGPAAPIVALSFIFGVMVLIALPIGIRRHAPGDAVFIAILCGLAIALWLIGIWRGRCWTIFELDEEKLRMTRAAPLFGKWASRELPWTRIRSIEVTWLKSGNAIAPALPCLQIEDPVGAHHTYLRGYSEEGLQWISDVLTSGRAREYGK